MAFRPNVVVGEASEIGRAANSAAVRGRTGFEATPAPAWRTATRATTTPSAVTAAQPAKKARRRADPLSLRDSFRV